MPYQELTEKVKNSVHHMQHGSKLVTEYDLTKLEGYAKTLFDRFALFKAADRVKLARTPEITEKVNWGWLSVKHLMVKGATGTVQDVDCVEGRFCFYITLDKNTWIDSDGIERPSGNQGLFCFWEGEIEKESS